jgi:hypothetical protein
MFTIKSEFQNFLKSFVLFSIAFLPLAASCGNTTGSVVQLQVSQGTNNNVYLITTGVNSSVPACASATGKYVFDISTAPGKAVYAGVLSAKLTNNTITVVGSNTCTLDASSENVVQVQF